MEGHDGRMGKDDGNQDLIITPTYMEAVNQGVILGAVKFQNMSTGAGNKFRNISTTIPSIKGQINKKGYNSYRIKKREQEMGWILKIRWA